MKSITPFPEMKFAFLFIIVAVASSAWAAQPSHLVSR